jgi:hypothetical protein
MGLSRKSFILFCSFALLAGPLFAAAEKEKLADLQARFDKESSSVHKAKLLEKLGGAQFEETRRLEKVGDFNSVGLLWEKFRDNGRVTLEALKKQHADAERHSNGYRELEVVLREGIRELDQTLLIAPEEFRPPLQIVRGDLAAMDDEVLRMLFPRRSIDLPSTPAAARASPEKQP